MNDEADWQNFSQIGYIQREYSILIFWEGNGVINDIY